MPRTPRKPATKPANPAADLFNTNPTPPPVVVRPTISPAFRSTILQRMQEVMGTFPASLDGDQVRTLKAQVAAGNAVQIPVTQQGFGQNGQKSVILLKSDDLDASTAFYFKTTGGMAGENYYGPFDV